MRLGLTQKCVGSLIFRIKNNLINRNILTIYSMIRRRTMKLSEAIKIVFYYMVSWGKYALATAGSRITIMVAQAAFKHGWAKLLNRCVFNSLILLNARYNAVRTAARCLLLSAPDSPQCEYFLHKMHELKEIRDTATTMYIGIRKQSIE